MRTEYYKRTNKIMGGSSTKHYPSGTAILMDMIVTAVHKKCNEFKKK